MPDSLKSLAILIVGAGLVIWLGMAAGDLVADAIDHAHILSHLESRCSWTLCLHAIDTRAA